jgi:hypothetical protein
VSRRSRTFGIVRAVNDGRADSQLESRRTASAPRAFQVDAVAGVFAGIAMSLNALVTSLLVPLAVTLLVR